MEIPPINEYRTSLQDIMNGNLLEAKTQKRGNLETQQNQNSFKPRVQNFIGEKMAKIKTEIP